MILDVNISWGNWPFQYFGFASIPEMKNFLLKNGIRGGLIRSAEAAFNPDLTTCNKKLFEQVREDDAFIPVATVSPFYSEWKNLCDSGKSPICAVFPSYHGYSLLANEFVALAENFEKKNLALLIVVRQEDERAHHKLCKIPPVPIDEVNALAKRHPKLGIICVNCLFGELQPLLKDAPNVFADIAFVETMNTMNTVVAKIGSRQIVFGSHTPFLYTEAALRKLKDLAADKNIVEDIAFANAQKIVKWKPF